MSWIQPQGKISTARLDLGKSRSSTADFSVVECKPLGEMAEWPIVQHWKCCVSERAPGVRIPLSPLSYLRLLQVLMLKLFPLVRRLDDMGL